MPVLPGSLPLPALLRSGTDTPVHDRASRPSSGRSDGPGTPDDNDGGRGDGGHGDGDGSGESGRVRWVTVAAFSLATEAHLARLKLEAEDVDCVLVDEHLISTNWLLSPAIGGIKLQVPEDQLARAREVLGAQAVEWDEADQKLASACPHCGVGEFVPAPRARWTFAVSLLLLGLPLLFLPKRWVCDHCGTPL